MQRATCKVLIALSLFALGALCDSAHGSRAAVATAANASAALPPAPANATSSGSRYYLKPNYAISTDNSSQQSIIYSDVTIEQGAATDSPQERGADAYVASWMAEEPAASLYAQHLERSSVIFGLTRVVNESDVSAVCYAQLMRVQRSILRREPWAMKVLDASGTKSSGFVFGQNFWLGSREACNSVRQPMSITLSRNYERVMHYALITESAPFAMDYRVVYLRHNSPWQVEIKVMSEQVIHIGLCLPSACASPQIQTLTAQYMARGLLVENDIYDIRPEVLYMKDLKLTDRFYQRPTLKLLTALLAFTGAMMLLAAHLRVLAVAEAERKANAVKDVSNMESEDAFVAILWPPKRMAGALRKMQEFVQCFDIIENFHRLCTIRANAPNEIPIINGLRSLSALWIMIFHVFWYMYFTVNNKAFLVSFGERAALQAISCAPLLVDAFFTISGFLQTYNYLRNPTRIAEVRQQTFGQNVKAFFKALLHRYLRLGTLYLVVVVVVDLAYTYIGEMSVFDVQDRFDEYCGQYWWRNILFIQNFFDHHRMCLNWSWSLACEMQYFVLASILLLSYAKHPKTVKAVVGSLLLAQIGWSFHVGISTKFQMSFDAYYATGNDIYINPFVRALPYILGAISAWVLLEVQPKLELSDVQEKSIWHLAVLIFLSCFYSAVWRDMSPMVSTGLFVIGRVAFSLSICWMIVGSCNGRGVWWSRVLELPIFQHLNRLSYAIYLLNPIVISFFFSNNDASTQVNAFMVVLFVAGFIVVVYFTAFIFSMAFEIPYCNWSSAMLRSSRSSSVKQKAT